MFFIFVSFLFVETKAELFIGAKFQNSAVFLLVLDFG